MILIILVWSAWFISEYMGYQPNKINQIQEELNQFKKFYNEIKDVNLIIKTEFPNTYISKAEILSKSWTIFSWATMKIERLGTIKWLWYNIEWVTLWIKDDPESVFKDWEKTKWFELYVEDMSSFKYIITKWEDIINSTQWAIEWAKNGEYVYFWTTEFDFKFNDKLWEKNYIWPLLIIKTIWVFIAIITWLVLLTFIIRSILYYIILWKFNPEK